MAGGLYTAPTIYETLQGLWQIGNSLPGSSRDLAWKDSQIYCRVKMDKAPILMLCRPGFELLNCGYPGDACW